VCFHQGDTTSGVYLNRVNCQSHTESSSEGLCSKRGGIAACLQLLASSCWRADSVARESNILSEPVESFRRFSVPRRQIPDRDPKTRSVPLVYSHDNETRSGVYLNSLTCRSRAERSSEGLCSKRGGIAACLQLLAGYRSGIKRALDTDWE
jgi:hypothetical protein